MKYKTYIIKFICTLSLFASLGCEDTLDVTASDAFSEDLVYSDPDQVENLVYTAYNSTEGWSVNRFNWWGRRFNIEAASFEAKFNFNDLDQFRLRAEWTPSNVGVLADKWQNYFDYVRSINEFLDRIDNSGAMAKDPDQTNVLKAEMRFLRANVYRKLINYFGGVPIMEHALGLDDDFNLVRNSYEECVDFIVNELDEAIVYLPTDRPGDEFGRATKLSALAVKSRTLLYAASKLHDPSYAPSNDPLYTYNKPNKWLDASNAAKAVIDMVGYRDLISVANAKDYQDLFLSPNQDILFARPYGAEYYEFGLDANSLWDLTQSPNGYGGWALSSPTPAFTMQFNMNDGSSTSSSAFNPDEINENREMRYYANLLFNGADFRGRNVQYYLSDDVNTYPHGLDSPEGTGNALHSSKTGYNIRKFQDENVEVAGGISPQRPFILFRLAEIYLNYAEAQYHLGNEALALEALNKVSKRALQPVINTSGTDLLEAIRRERRVELCFEGHNFFDERRWMIESHLGMQIDGLKWKKASDGTEYYNIEPVVTRPWSDKMYYLPIPQTEVEKAPSIKQNYGY
ncbi:RagB/SusD family nutrient uptake outer membrane protein [Tamlana agarivorans]|uniref:RagB/SusD family nutrient uptake outer membrane protein n=1 Tax=Pseudotamlana agarivorans TaxID=481183 RepID=A0ACC5U9L1_9FLAO|nr:RagB/SusD family nutrient uptake outer membrane protein [Tamlana agarivorans]MBU2951014.1 RagB/SusD family nutrient uptake outer membrane protein [Tamlana agarivorans]